MTAAIFPSSTVIETGATPYINAIDEGETSTLHIRARATETSPQGQEQTLTLYPRSAAPSGLSYDPVTATVSGVTTDMQYRVQGGTWAAVTGTTQSVENLLSATTNATLEVRYKAVNGVSSASPSTTLTLNQLPEAPYLSLNLRREAVTGFDTQKSYQYNTTGSATTWSSVVLNNGEFSLNGIINKNNAVTLYIREASTGTTPASAPVLLSVPKLQDAPTTARFIYNDPIHPNQAVLTGMTTDMEFRRSVDTAWTLYTGEDIVLDIPSSNMNCFVRKIAQGTLPNSALQNLTLLTGGSAPSVTLDTSAEIVKTLTTAMEISTDGINYTTPTTSSYCISDIIDSATNVALPFYVRTKATTSSPASQNKTIYLYPRFAAPTGFTYNPFTCIISGVSSVMEYTVPGAASWLGINSTSLNVEQYLSGTSNTTILIRRKAVTGASASKPTEVILDQLPVGPLLSLDLSREVITGFSSDKTYQQKTNSSSGWSNITLINNEFYISNQILNSADRILTIREARTSTVPASAPTSFIIPMRPDAPYTPVFIYNNANYPDQAVLTGLSAFMEYRLSSSTSWTPCTGEDIVLDIPSSSVFYYVRTIGQGSTVTASLEKKLTLQKRAAIYAPSVTLNTTTETIGTLYTEMEVSTDGTNYTPITEATSNYSVSDIIDATTTGTSTFYVRIKATPTAPYSASLTFTLYPRAAEPTSLSYDAENKMITGVDSTMECRVVGTSTWTGVGSASTISVSNYLATGYTQVQVRYKPVNNVSSASLPVTIDIY